MSDTNLPPHSYPTSDVLEAGHGSDAGSSDATSLAFLALKSSDSSEEKCQVVDGCKRENKQKRKRTSPEDQKILETEYRNNPKPNKAARVEIVEKLSLNEKEVQIWFQNRRQITRRKTRPLQPHEIAEFGLGGIGTLSSDRASMVGFGSSQETDKESNSHARRSPENVRLSPMPNTIVTHAVENSSQGLEVGETRPHSNLLFNSTVKSAENTQSRSPDLSTPASSFSITKSVARSFSSTPGYLSNRWNTVRSSFSGPPSSQGAIPGTPPISMTHLPSSCPERIGKFQALKRSSSQARLSMALDGKAQLISSETSPPRAQTVAQTRRVGLHRSYSPLPYSQLPTISHTAPKGLMPLLPSGRSRDARAWESACGAKPRDELTTQAAHESSGSATAAINLLRSTSNGKITLQSNPNKRNALSHSHHTSQSKNGKKPTLVRTTSSLARLQTTTNEPCSNLFRDPLKQQKGTLIRSPSGDSDKENWSPTEDPSGGNQRRRPLPSARLPKQPITNSNTRSILGENHHIPAHASNLREARIGDRKRAKQARQLEPHIFEDVTQDSDIPPEVEKFMRGEVSPGKKGDLDCIQGLLSLSQGNWR